MKKTKKLKNFDKEKQMRRKEEKGITLIALVITIIVLLILAGVSIATLTGENGILTKVNKAKDETEKASEEEQRELAQINAAMHDELWYYKEGVGELTQEEGKEIERAIPIPAGFAPTGIEGENSIEDGFVITDSEGNEFVWIPVENSEIYKRNITYRDIGISTNTNDDEEYLPDGIIGEQGKDREKEIVIKAGGFYIGRYEVGTEGGKLEEIKNEKEEVTEANWKEEPTLVCKKGAKVYNWISQENAKIKAKKFINKEDVKSALISGIQWDVVMENINNKKDGIGNSYDVSNSSSNRHLGKLFESGKNDADNVYNIYDLEGNFYEYVAEKYTGTDKSGNYIYRGGFCDVLREASNRFYGNGDAFFCFTFRLVLYVF